MRRIVGATVYYIFCLTLIPVYAHSDSFGESFSIVFALFASFILAHALKEYADKREGIVEKDES